MDQLNKLTELQPGKRYTVVGMGEFGFPYQFQIVLTEVRVERYAQYPQTFLLIFKQKGKRLPRQLRFYDTRSVIVWEGWVSPNTNMYPFTSIKDYDSGPVTVRTGYPCFDKRYMQIARDSVKAIPLVECFERTDGPILTKLDVRSMEVTE